MAFARVFRSFVWLGLAGVTGALARDHRFSEEERNWWAVQPVAEIEVPDTEHGIDHFVQGRLAKSGLKMAEKAGAAELIRRVYFDLHGLPPGKKEVTAFVEAFKADEDRAVRHLIDRLLESPRYGERWGQHWLDVVRYAESDGYRADDFRPNAYQYRDYVVRSFNEDKPYDRFVMEQLAADEMGVTEPSTLVATGFLRLGVYEWNQRDAEMQRKIMIDEMTAVTGEVFMGLGVGCAQCHDHKFDPILQEDYLRLQAFLSTTWFPDDQKFATAVELRKYEEHQRKWERATARIQTEMEELLREGQGKIGEFRVKSFPSEVQEMFRKPVSRRTAYEEQIAQLVRRQVEREVVTRGKPEQVLKKGSEARRRYDELALKLAAFEHLKPRELERAFVSRDVKPVPALVTAGAGKPVIQPGFLAILNEREPDIVRQENSTGRRLALAKWLVRKDNPLTARVIVNRIWQHHFGKGLVSTSNDFGMLGEPPSHPELLDFLSRKFVNEGWSIKEMHRYIMMSRAYRQTARYEPSHAETLVDPENRLLWRFPPRRLSAEEVRDAMLALSGELVDQNGGASKGDDSVVRSLYVRKKRNTPNPVLQCFDAPQGFASSPDRLNTTTAPQSLFLANSEWPLARARALAKRILGENKAADREDVRKVFESVWDRRVKKEIIDDAMDFLEHQRSLKKAESGEPGSAQHSMFEVLPDLAKTMIPPGAEVALRLDPNGRYQRLALPEIELEEGQFAVSAVVQLNAIHHDAKVNILASKWSHDHGEPGWTLGVTSEKSRYGARNLIMQLVGRNPGGDLEYEVVASNLRFPLGRPVLVRVAVSKSPAGRGLVSFLLQDLSQDVTPSVKVVDHGILGDWQRSEVQLVLGGGAKTSAHGWRGSFAWVRFDDGEAPVEEPLKWTGNEVVFREHPENPTDGGKWLFGADKREWSEGREAFADLCHVLLMSNEFLYLH